MTPLEMLESIQKRIQQAQLKSPFGQEVLLIGASKKQTSDHLKPYIDAGLKDFGENYLQEADTKISELDKSICWHFIGPVQSKKAKDLVGKFDWIHGVATESGLKALQKSAAKLQKTQSILLQVNLFGENSKSGFTQSQLFDVLPRLAEFANLKVCGLMSLPPLAQTETQAREQFSLVRETLVQGKSLIDPSKRELFQHLSMGTSADFEWAIQEGATMVRLGTVLLGERS